MRIQDLEYYLALAELGSFSQVSKRFNISQPTVSLAMQRLEKELTSELIWRDPGHQKMAFTHPGQILLEHAKKIVQEYQQAQVAIQKEAEQKFALGLSEMVDLAYYPAIKEHLSDHFFTHLQKSLVQRNEGLRLLQDGKVDALLVIGSANLAAPYRVEEIAHPALLQPNGQALPDFTLSFIYQDSGQSSETMTAILSELKTAIHSASQNDFTLISKTE
ncbi:LysR substrate binding domain protein [Fructobacillus fructosus]|uniref:LysR family transcriptional regulator n=1 Tax=Fructobacillus fructosus TaxID=1631 RepID=UPI00021955F3|nr:LysR family transcriptional regulator [Fructobacillus fructosus]KRN52658.1 LysR family malolactic regulator [Fructobacillus fructosus KCTC 3544]GAP01342.1 LysR substrate binding domain protein [Fructobacillus fructosus]